MDTITPVRGLRDLLADVLADPSRDSFRELLRHHTGEATNLDFKQDWPSDEKLARHMLALGNSGGGCMVIGVAERDDKSLDPVGLATFKDKVDVTKKVGPLVPESLLRNLHVDDFAYESSDYGALQGKRFQLVSVMSDPEHLPFVAVRANGDARASAIYVRRGTESVEANHDELQRIINARVTTGHSTRAAMDLEEHLDQLKVLEERIPRTLVSSDFSGALASIGRLYAQQIQGMFGNSVTKPNPTFPAEDYQGFVARMFEAKKKRIEQELDVR